MDNLKKQKWTRAFREKLSEKLLENEEITATERGYLAYLLGHVAEDFGASVSAYKEIRAARNADAANKKLIPLKTIADTLRKGEFERLSPEVWGEVADFIECKHRRKKGEKLNVLARQGDSTLWNEVVEYKSREVLKGRRERGLTTEAKQHVVEKYKLDMRDLDRRLARHQKKLIEAVAREQQEYKEEEKETIILQG